MFPASRHLSIAAAWAVLAAAARADPVLAPLFSDHAVLQCDKSIAVWGRANPGEHISVSFDGQKVGATTGTDGRWIAYLDPLGASAEGGDLVVAGKTEVAIHDVLVGEVWLCSGQSNMEYALESGAYKVDGAQLEVAAARYPAIRQFKVGRQAASRPMDTATGDWAVCSPQTAGEFTAVGYFFAREIAGRLGVPFGIIDCSYADTPLESWLSPAALAEFPGYSNGHRAADGAAVSDPWVPGSLFNGMVNPLAPYGMRGILWYQGESNVGRAQDYAVQFPRMIRAWRAHFGQGDLPFLWVQLANFQSPSDRSGVQWAYLREAQARALSLAATGQAVAIDIGDPGNIHPSHKQEVGRRLALIAKARVYSIPVDFSGPVFARARAEGPSMVVEFQFAGDGLTASGRPLQSFEVAGEDRVFHKAMALIRGDTVVVQSAAVSHPVAVRYAWQDSPDANLFNGAGLPAAPFRSDDW